MVFQLTLSDSKFPHVSRTRLRILAVLSNAVILIVSTRPPTSKSFRPFNNPLVIVPKAPITIGTIVTFMFHSFFNSLARSRYLSFFSLSFRFILWSARTAKSTILQILFFFFFVNYYEVWSSGGIMWSVCILKSRRSLLSLLSLLLLNTLWVFHTSFGWWAFTKVWVAVGLVRSQWLSILANTLVVIVSIPPPISTLPAPYTQHISID